MITLSKHILYMYKDATWLILPPQIPTVQASHVEQKVSDSVVLVSLTWTDLSRKHFKLTNLFRKQH